MGNAASITQRGYKGGQPHGTSAASSLGGAWRGTFAKYIDIVGFSLLDQRPDLAKAGVKKVFAGTVSLTVARLDMGSPRRRVGDIPAAFATTIEPFGQGGIGEVTPLFGALGRGICLGLFLFLLFCVRAVAHVRGRVAFFAQVLHKPS